MTVRPAKSRISTSKTGSKISPAKTSSAKTGLVVYGRNPVFELLTHCPGQIKNMVALQGKQKPDPRLQQLVRLAEQAKITVQWLEKAAFDGVLQRYQCTEASHQGIVARVRPFPETPFGAMARSVASKNGLLLALDGITDPQNLGALLRVADAAGVGGVFWSQNHSAPITSAVLKASSGAAFTVPWGSVTHMPLSLQQLKKQGFQVYGSLLSPKAQPYHQVVYQPNRPLVLVVGSEGDGMSPGVAQQCDACVVLPMLGKVQSLNVATATAVLLYEMLRQRS